MNLFVDVGNTYLKAATKSGVAWEIVFMCKITERKRMIRWLDGLGLESVVIFTSVRSEITELINSYSEKISLFSITNELLVHFEFDYKTPKTLGMDRFLACLGANSLTGKSTIVVDAGTAVTVDLMTADRIYRGGVIMPGLRSFHSAMEENLPQLPSLDHTLPKSFPGLSTNECLQWGVNGAYVSAVESFINRFLEFPGTHEIFISGGDAKFLQEHLADSFSLKVRKWLVFDGMMEAFHFYLNR